MTSTILLGVPVFVYIASKGNEDFSQPLQLVSALGPFLVAGAGLFSISGYSISEGKLLVHRPFWVTKFKLEDLETVTVSREKFWLGIRLFGSGGFWGWYGWFWNREHGYYRILASGLDSRVILKWNKKTLVVSPNDPEEFLKKIGLQKN